VNLTIAVAVVFAALLGLEWRYRLRSARIAASVLAFVVLFFAGPNLTAARRRALAAPPAERVTRIADHQLSEYESGVHTMTESISESANRRAYPELLSLGALFWLACSPVFRRTPGAAPEGRVASTSKFPSDVAGAA
jgi:hypothetical protein